MGLSENNEKHLGLQPGYNSVLSDSTLFRYYFAMKKANMIIPKTDAYKRSVVGSFHPYTGLAVATDHVLMRLGRDVIEACFHALPSTAVRIQVDVVIKPHLKNNEPPYQSAFYNASSKNIHSLTMTTVFCLLLVLHPTARFFLPKCEDIIDIVQATLHFNYSLQSRYTIQYYCPTTKDEEPFWFLFR